MFQGRRTAGLIGLLNHFFEEKSTTNLSHMLNPQVLDSIELLISTKKAALYRKNIDDLEWFNEYRKEVNEAKEAFVYLHFLEIFLRNKITAEFGKDFGNGFFYHASKVKFNPKEQEKINLVIVAIRKSRKELNLDNIVSNLSLGFWTNLFHRPYTKIWQKNKMVERVFPFLKSCDRDLKKIQKELEIIRKFRNRIFHFESLKSFNNKDVMRLTERFIYGISGIKIKEILDE